MKKVRGILLSVYRHKLHIVIFVFFFVLFFIAYFPKDKAIRIVFNSISEQTGVTIVPIEPDMGFFPSISLSANSVSIKPLQGIQPINLGRTSISVPLSSIITFSPAISIGTESFRGNIGANILGIPINPSRRIEELYLDLNSERINLGDLLRGRLPLSLTGGLNLGVQGNLNVINPIFSDIDITGTVSNLKIERTMLMGFPIPEISVSGLDAAIAVDRGDIVIARLEAGSPTEDISLSVRGTVSFQGNRPYDLNIRLRVAGELENQFGQFLMMLPAQAKNEEGYYNINVSGSQRTPMPQITPIQ